MMLKLAVLAACAACTLAQGGGAAREGAAQSGATDPAGAIDAKCDEPRTYDIMRADAWGAECYGVQYDPRKYRCCGRTLRRLAGSPFSMPSSQDPTIGQESDSQFCYRSEHVSSRQIVCGGEVVSAGTWDAFGRQLTVVSCCVGKTYTKEEITYASADRTSGVSSKKISGCCQGTVFDLQADASTMSATLGCCGSSTYNLQNEICCDGTVHAKDSAKICCGGSYVQNDPKMTCCNGVMETEVDAEGNKLGFCCSGSPGVKVETWNLLADVMSKATAPEADSNDAVWTVNKVCGCKNELVDVSKGYIDGQTITDQPIFTNEFLCTNGKDAKSPCSAALIGQKALEDSIGCCDSEEYYIENSDCVNMFYEADAISASKGEEVTEIGPSFGYGSHLRKNFVPDGNYMFEPVNPLYSKNFYNQKTDVVDVYCGKSSAATAVASVLVACLAFLAL